MVRAEEGDTLLEIEDDRDTKGFGKTAGRAEVGLVPARIRLSRGRVLDAGGGFMTSWEADMDGRSLRGVVDPLVGKVFNVDISSPFPFGDDPFDLLSVDEVS